MTDVLFFHTPDGGNIDVRNGVVTMDDGYTAAAYLSLFGGNAEDAGDTATESKQWWGNVDEADQARVYRSEFQHLLNGLPAIPANMVRLEQAAIRDLSRTFDDIADSIAVAISIPALNRITVDITMLINAAVHRVTFTEDWGPQT